MDLASVANLMSNNMYSQSNALLDGAKSESVGHGQQADINTLLEMIINIGDQNLDDSQSKSVH